MVTVKFKKRKPVLKRRYIMMKKKRPTNNILFKPIKVNTKQNISNIKRKDLTWDQASIRYPKIKAFGDSDRDGKLNIFDCRPFDNKRHSEKRKRKVLAKGTDFYIASSRKFDESTLAHQGPKRMQFNTPHVSHSKAVAVAIASGLMAPGYAPEGFKPGQTVYRVKSNAPIAVDKEITIQHVNEKRNPGYTRERLPELGKEDLKKIGFIKRGNTRYKMNVDKMEPVNSFSSFKAEAAEELVDDPSIDLGKYRKYIPKTYIANVKKARQLEQEEEAEEEIETLQSMKEELKEDL